MSDKSQPESLISATIGKHYVVFMRKGPAWHPIESPDDIALQNAHLAFLKSLHDSGKTLVHGPVVEGPDDTLRGFNILQANSAEEVRTLLEADPRVQAGHLVLEIF